MVFNLNTQPQPGHWLPWLWFHFLPSNIPFAKPNLRKTWHALGNAGMIFSALSHHMLKSSAGFCQGRQSKLATARLPRGITGKVAVLAVNLSGRDLTVDYDYDLSLYDRT